MSLQNEGWGRIIEVVGPYRIEYPIEAKNLHQYSENICQRIVWDMESYLAAKYVPNLRYCNDCILVFFIIARFMVTSTSEYLQSNPSFPLTSINSLLQKVAQIALSLGFIWFYWGLYTPRNVRTTAWIPRLIFETMNSCSSPLLGLRGTSKVPLRNTTATTPWVHTKITLQVLNARVELHTFKGKSIHILAQTDIPSQVKPGLHGSSTESNCVSSSESKASMTNLKVLFLTNVCKSSVQMTANLSRHACTVEYKL